MTSQLPGFWCFLLLAAEKKTPKTGQPLTLLRSFLFHDDFKISLFSREREREMVFCYQNCSDLL